MPGEVEQAAPCCQIKECGLEVLNWQVNTMLTLERQFSDAGQ